MRADLAIIADLIAPGARVLDLGCGTGELLEHLQVNKQVNGYGLEIDPGNITAVPDAPLYEFGRARARGRVTVGPIAAYGQ